MKDSNGRRNRPNHIDWEALSESASNIIDGIDENFYKLRQYLNGNTGYDEKDIADAVSYDSLSKNDLAAIALVLDRDFVDNMTFNRIIAFLVNSAMMPEEGNRCEEVYDLNDLFPDDGARRWFSTNVFGGQRKVSTLQLQEIKHLSIEGLNAKSLNIGWLFSNLETVGFYNCNISALDFGNLVSLNKVMIDDLSKIEDIDVFNCTELDRMDVDTKALKSLSFTDCSPACLVVCNSEQLSSIEFNTKEFPLSIWLRNLKFMGMLDLTQYVDGDGVCARTIFDLENVEAQGIIYPPHCSCNSRTELN